MFVVDSIPCIRKPWATWALITVLTVLFLTQLPYNDATKAWFFSSFSLGGKNNMPAGLTFFTHMFIHSNFSAFIINVVFLYTFADNVEDLMGPWRFLLFFVTCGLTSAIVYSLLSNNSDYILYGATGGTAGVLGGYFLLYPYSIVRGSWRTVYFEMKAFYFLAAWFIFTLLSGYISKKSGVQTSNLANLIGGYITGLSLIPLFRDKDSYLRACALHEDIEDFILQKEKEEGIPAKKKKNFFITVNRE